MDKSNLEKSLKEGIVVFKYKKSDGTERKAIGTLLPHLIPSKASTKAEELRTMLRELVFSDDTTGEVLLSAKELLDSVEPQSPTKAASPELVSYFDLGLGQWRSFKIENLIKIVGIY